MAAVSDELAAQSIFVAGVTPRPDNSAPILRLLADMPAPSAEELRKESDFSILFRETLANGSAGHAMVLCADGQVVRTSVRDRPEYRSRWHAAPVEARVFLSFTRADLPLARKVQAALERIGLRVFTYLANEDDRIWTNSVDVGHYFDSAGHHVVVDTPNARASVATRFEQLAVTGLLQADDKLPAVSVEDAVERLRQQELFAEVPTKNADICCRICIDAARPARAPERQCEDHLAQPDDRTCAPVICGSQCQNAY